ncbi:MAG: S26 family signal peptidase [Planctomycetota bacterium]
MPTWFLLGVVAVGSAVGISLLTMGKKTVIEIELSNKAMRPAIGEKQTRFTVDPSWLTERSKNAVVAFTPPGGGNLMIARVVALPGDRIKVVKKRLHVNGKLLRSSSRRTREDSVPEFICPAGCVYVLIDNAASRITAKDSLDFGPLPVWRVVGSLPI